MVALLIANTVALSISVVAMVGLTYKWLSAERKLAKHGESKIYKVKENRK